MLTIAEAGAPRVRVREALHGAQHAQHLPAGTRIAQRISQVSGVAQVQVGSGGVEARLDAERTPGREVGFDRAKIVRDRGERFDRRPNER